MKPHDGSGCMPGELGAERRRSVLPGGLCRRSVQPGGRCRQSGAGQRGRW